MESKDLELLPCPFCGSEKSRRYKDKEGFDINDFVSCSNCGCKVSGWTPEEAADNWNRRTTAFTTVDLANADADGFRNGRASVVVELPKGGNMWNDEPVVIARADAVAAIIAAGGSVKE